MHVPEHATYPIAEGKETTCLSLQCGSRTYEIIAHLAGGRVPCCHFILLVTMERTGTSTGGEALGDDLPWFCNAGPFCARRDGLLRLFDAWKRVTMDGVLHYLEENWRNVSRCHICHYIGHVMSPQVCPQCGSWNRLSAVQVPLHRCHQCPFIGNPDFCQECPLCDRRNTLSLYMVRKLYENQIFPVVSTEQ